MFKESHGLSGFSIVFAVFNAIIYATLWQFYPETLRLSLEEMDLLFAQDEIIVRKSPRDSLDGARMVHRSPHFQVSESSVSDTTPNKEKEGIHTKFTSTVASALTFSQILYIIY